MFRFQGWEPIVVLLIILLLFGPGRIAKIAKELGSSITAFRSGLKDDGQNKDESSNLDTKSQ
jgi:sec-independent protein translocase protein TatA